MDETASGMLVVAMIIVCSFIIYALYKGEWVAAMFGIGMVTVTAFGGVFVHERY